MNPNLATSVTLLEDLLNRDQHAWQRLHQLYNPLVRAWCQRFGAPPQDWDDVSQEVFAAVADALPEFRTRGTGSFRSWLRGITRFKALDNHRRRAGQPAALGGTVALDLLHAVADPESPEADREELGTLYRRAVDLIRRHFEERTFQAFWLTAVEARPTDAVAAELGMTPVAVRIAKSRVLAKLREEVGELIA